MTHAAHIASIEHAADMPSLLGMDRVVRMGDSHTTASMTDPDFMGSVAICQVGGELKIESKFESAYDVPIGDIPVEVIGLDDGSSTRVMLDEHGSIKLVQAILEDPLEYAEQLTIRNLSR
ncbi:hypothetical protein [Pseudomonas cyclaminis]|uniref:hypothetical protein n=1 Tax=Pseudomonas cyclaminis TaxID=2781239 RepID=UPI001FE6EDAC|nr:hypothetical protein [Pseudomonas cyclaminis]